MSEKPKRPWFQFHLLTAVLTMVAAGIGLFANIPLLRVLKSVESSDGRYATYIYTRGGWPFRDVATTTLPIDMDLGNGLVSLRLVSINALVWLSVIVAVALVWLYQGLWCKLLARCPGHLAIVQAVPGLGIGSTVPSTVGTLIVVAVGRASKRAMTR